MNETTAKLSAALSVILIAAATLILWVTSHPGPGATPVKAEFEDAFPVLAGMNVRVSGAVAGSVREVELTDNGTAMMTLSLNPGTEPPREDASAAIRQQDVTGDSYVSLSPGSAAAPLGSDEIPTSRTLVAPRFDDLLNSFAEPERQALKTILIETGMALEHRGEDLNQATLYLRPALSAADNALSEVASQNKALRSLVTDAARVTGQAAHRSSELAGLVDSLSATLSTTAQHGPGLDRALERLPATATAAKHTLTRLRHTAVAARPLARSLDAGAPGLARTLKLGGPFLGDVRHALDNLNPTLAATTDALSQGRSTLQAAPRHVATAPFELAGNVDDLLRTLLGNEDVLRSLFGADGYGVQPASDDDVGLGAIAPEGGRQAGYGDYDPLRNFLRAVVVPSCEAFGLKIVPGCLLDAVSMMSHGTRRRPAGGSGRAPAALATPPPTVPGTDATGSPPAVGGAPAAPGPGPSGHESPTGVNDLLDFLLGGGS